VQITGGLLTDEYTHPAIFRGGFAPPEILLRGWQWTQPPPEKPGVSPPLFVI